MLEQGYVLLPSGPEGRVLSLTPPLSIEESALLAACDAIAAWLRTADGADGRRA
jgi:4-aminobutyrate aminotransferase-like enzyme